MTKNTRLKQSYTLLTFGNYQSLCVISEIQQRVTLYHLKEGNFGLLQWTQSLFTTTTIKQRRQIGHFIHDDEGSEDTDVDKLFRALN